MIKHKKSNKKTKLVIAFLVLLALLAVAYYLIDRKSNSSTPVNQTETLNLAPPTKEDKQRVEDNKQRIVNDQNKAASVPAQSSGLKAVTPTITYAGRYNDKVEVGAFVSGIFEDGGQCTATFTKDSNKITKSVTAIKGATSVDCPVMSASSSEFSVKGSWQVTVSYSSPTSTGASTSKQVEIK